MNLATGKDWCLDVWIKRSSLPGTHLGQGGCGAWKPGWNGFKLSQNKVTRGAEWLLQRMARIHPASVLYSGYFSPIFQYLVTWQIFLHHQEGVVEPLSDAHDAVHLLHGLHGLPHHLPLRHPRPRAFAEISHLEFLAPSSLPDLDHNDLFFSPQIQNIYQAFRIIVCDTFTEGFCEPWLFWRCLCKKYFLRMMATFHVLPPFLATLTGF